MGHADSHLFESSIARYVLSISTLLHQILEAYEGTLDEVPANEAYEHSEMLLFKSRVLMEAGRLQEALNNLESHKDKVCWEYAGGHIWGIRMNHSNR